MSTSDWYTHIDPTIMEWSHRQQALIDHIASFQSDLICLQEVEPEFFQTLLGHLSEQGFDGKFVRKLQDHPDGLAFFYKPESIKLTNYNVSYFHKSSAKARDWRPAQLITFEHRGKEFGLINTHLAWNQSGTLAHAQLTELIQKHIQPRALDGWIICGDFNVTADQAAIQLLRDQGLEYAYRGLEQATCSIKEFTGKVDYIFYSSDSLKATADRIGQLAMGHVLPSARYPSDHLAITAHITHR